MDPAYWELLRIEQTALSRLESEAAARADEAREPEAPFLRRRSRGLRASLRALLRLTPSRGDASQPFPVPPSEPELGFPEPCAVD